MSDGVTIQTATLSEGIRIIAHPYMSNGEYRECETVKSESGWPNFCSCGVYFLVKP